MLYFSMKTFTKSMVGKVVSEFTPTFADKEFMETVRKNYAKSQSTDV